MKKFLLYSGVLLVMGAFVLIAWPVVFELFSNGVSSVDKTPGIALGNLYTTELGVGYFQYIAWATFLLGLSGVVFGFIQVGAKRLKEHNKQLERLVKERTKVVADKHQAMENQNREYKEALLLIREQKEEIEATQQDLLVKNQELKEALEEISTQNEVIDHDRSKLEQAKRIIQEQNRKLLNIARNLDRKVHQRTEELFQANTLLVEKNKELDDFIYKSAHDLRGPIARFKGLSQLIRMEYKEGNDIDNHLHRLEVGANQMDNMLTRLSNVYEISARPISPQSISMEDLIASVIDRLKREEKFESINFDIQNKVNGKLDIDVTFLHLILKNLMANAIRFRDDLKDDRFAKVLINKADDTLLIDVSDNGIGIKEYQREKIFDLFYVGSELPKGPGLGLYICKIITKKLKGRIALMSAPNAPETTFRVQIPLS